MAEAVFRHLVNEAGLDNQISVDSAGTGQWHVGAPPHHGTRSILAEKRINDDGIIARQLKKEDFSQFHYILVMDDDNLKAVKQLAGNKRTGEIYKLLKFHPSKSEGDVPDPYYTGNFTEVYEMVEQSCRALLQYIRERENV